MWERLFQCDLLWIGVRPRDGGMSNGHDILPTGIKDNSELEQLLCLVYKLVYHTFSFDDNRDSESVIRNLVAGDKDSLSSVIRARGGSKGSNLWSQPKVRSSLRQV